MRDGGPKGLGRRQVDQEPWVRCKLDLHDISTPAGRHFRGPSDRNGVCRKCYEVKHPPVPEGYCKKRLHLLVNPDGSLTENARERVKRNTSGACATCVICYECARAWSRYNYRRRHAAGWTSGHCVIKGCTSGVMRPPGDTKEYLCKRHFLNPPAEFRSIMRKLGKTRMDYAFPGHLRSPKRAA